MRHQTWLRAAGTISAAALALTLTACGGSSEDDGVSTEPPATSAATTPAPEVTAEPTGTFSVTGEESIEGDLSEIVCVPSDDGTQVTAEITGSGTDGRLTVVTGTAPEGSDRRDSLTVQGGGDKIYSRISSDTLPYDLVDDGSKVTGSVVLADIQDVVEPDVDKRKQVTLTVDIDCG